MNTDVLHKIGLTAGEIRVYEAVIKLGNASTGPIMEKSGISSSKVYLILEKLMKKGLVTFSIERDVKKFQPANPITIIEFLSCKQQELEETKQEATKLVKEINSMIGSYQEETTRRYTGTKSMTTAYHNILDELKCNDFLFIGAPKKDMPKITLFFQNLHAKREHSNIHTRGIVSKMTVSQYQLMFQNRKNITLRCAPIIFPHAIAIGTKRVILSLWDEAPTAFEISSERVAKRYREFFETMWKSATKV